MLFRSLFDEQDEPGRALNEFGRAASFRFEGAYSGGRCIQVAKDRCVGATYVEPFGHRVPNWDFEIAEEPQAGQYRYLRFAWRALSEETAGLTLRVGPGHRGGVAVSAGTPSRVEGAKELTAAEKPPADWHVVTVDLWKAHGGPFRVDSFTLGAVGGPAAFDRVLLGRTEADLDAAAAPAKE